MITIRKNTFETNSSSCHSITLCNNKEWNDFINHKTCWRRSNWEIEEHLAETHRVVPEDIINIEDLYGWVSRVLNEKDRETFTNTYRNEYYAKAGIELDFAIFDWLKKEITSVDKLVSLCTSTDWNFKVLLDKEIIVKYSWNIEPTVYKSFGLYSICDVLKRIFSVSVGEFPYFYGGRDWETEKNTIQVSGDQQKPVTVNVPDNTTFETDDFIIVRNGDEITITNKGSGTITIERDEEC